MAFTETQAKEVVRQYLQADSGDPALDTIITSVLDASKAVESYRPFIAAAAVCNTILLRGGIIEADGVRWEPTSEVIEGLLALQAAFDVNLTIPSGWSVAEFRVKLIGTENPVFSAMVAI